MEVSKEYELEFTVEKEMCADAYGSGGMEVLATPHMIAMMEKAAFLCVAPVLKEGEQTVGTSVHVHHTRATPVGAKVRVHTILTAVEGRKLVFTVDAYDEKGSIGSGIHERFIVNEEKFLAKVYQ